jgi:hypothetical protein
MHDDWTSDGYLRLRYQPARSGGEEGSGRLCVCEFVSNGAVGCSIEVVSVSSGEWWLCHRWSRVDEYLLVIVI